MPRAKGKVNYKVATLIQVVEEKLPNGPKGWQEVAALYQSRSQEVTERDYEDVKRHWVEKCCNSFRTPPGDPGDPKHDMILKCQKIQGRILAKAASSIMGVASGEEEGDGDEEVAGLALGTASRGNSRDGTPTVDLANAEDLVAVPPGLPLQGLPTQESAEETSGVHRDFPPLMLSPPKLDSPENHREMQQSKVISVAAAKKKLKKSRESSLSKERTKNSLSEKSGSIIKSTERSSTATDEMNCNAVAASIMPMIMMLQSQMQMQHTMMQKEMEMHIKGQNLVFKRLLKEMKRKERKEQKRKKKKRKAVAAGAEKMEDDSSSSSSSLSSSSNSSLEL